MNQMCIRDRRTANESEGMDMSSRKITMDDIANMAGVTKSTVSRYFNGGSVKESTRERIQEIIREYNYAVSYTHLIRRLLHMGTQSMRLTKHWPFR